MVDDLLYEYSKVCNSEKEKEGSHGSLLMAVVNGRLSEGINFADRSGRGIIMIGLPFPDINSPEIVEKMKFIDRNSVIQKTNCTNNF